MVDSPQMLDQAYESIQRAVSIDHAVMEGAARNGSVVMGSMDVGWSDLGSWSALLAAIGARGTGAVVQAGETAEVDADDLVVRRVDGRLGVIAAPERGSITATHPSPCSVGPVRTWPSWRGSSSVVRQGRFEVTLVGHAPEPTTIVFGTDGWRADRRRVHLR